jgi:cytochrome c oxidase subunit 2
MSRIGYVFAALLAASSLATTAAAEDPKSGKVLFELCQHCHGDQGQGNRLALAPAIAGLEVWYVEAQLGFFRDGGRGDHPQDIPGLRMRPMSRSLHDAADVKAVSEYVASLTPQTPAPMLEGGDPAKGQELYKLCQQCHGPKGEGNQAFNAPRLSHTSDWYLASALERYKAGIRGSNPKNPNGIMMRGMAMSLADDQAIKDVVAYITTLGR